MPNYRYQCFECGLQFEKSVSIAKRAEKQPCLECAIPSERLMPEGINGFFNQSVSGPGPQNTGIAGLDAHVDRVIGTHAKQGWEVHDKRQAEKRQVLAEVPAAEVPEKALSKNPDGSYRVLKPEEKAIQERALSIHNMAMEQRKVSKSTPTQ